MASQPPPPAFKIAPSLQPYQITPAAYIIQHPIAHFIASGIVAHADRILLLQRSPHDVFGLHWEVPGGMPEGTEENVLTVAVRELWEETGLRAVRVTDLVDETHDWVHAGEVWRKVTFLMEVEETAGNGDGRPVVRLAEEHVDCVWASEEEVRAGRCEGRVLEWTSPEQERTVLRAFELLRVMFDTQWVHIA
ncbi:Uu.00g077150.m01.CDS01 [Anthostomella pinea]|uniref:Uu.00g077150.m01.CDS01 n=1 Tax=Anthostomella pinea TaxID=933095 RepID=A0AAI8VWX0_9PEZI|nr:Uu.00g077150.m01.CDS01 [Anthostomella pinea]